jgi:hypothetical protein
LRAEYRTALKEQGLSQQETDDRLATFSEEPNRLLEEWKEQIALVKQGTSDAKTDRKAREILDQWRTVVTERQEEVAQAKLVPELEERRQKALGEYRKVFENWPEGTYAEMARRRSKDLERQSTREFYNKLAAWSPPAAASAQPIPGTSPAFPPGVLPDGPEGMPDFSELLGTGGPEPAGEGGAGSPAPSDAPSDPDPSAAGDAMDPATPEDPAPADPAASDSMPADVAPDEAASPETEPVETSPVETAPSETAPLEAAPSGATPGDPAPDESGPTPEPTP